MLAQAIIGARPLPASMSTPTEASYPDQKGNKSDLRKPSPAPKP